MSILNRPGWANRQLINEGRLHSDELKQRITNLFQRTSLGNSPTYTVAKIADFLRREKGDDISINEISDEDIIKIANYKEVTNNKFSPKLKDNIINSRKETQETLSSNNPESSDNDINDIENNDLLDYEDTEDDYSDLSNNINTEIEYNDESENSSDNDQPISNTNITTSFSPETNELEFAGSISEDAEERKKKCGCANNPEQRPEDEPKMNKILSKTVKKESVKLSPKAVNKLLMENYIKAKQHKFRIEEKYRF